AGSRQRNAIGDARCESRPTRDSGFHRIAKRFGEYRSPAADHADAARDADCLSVGFATFLEGASVKIAHFFIDRPVFAIVISIVAIIAGAIAMFTLPIAQYPQIAP